MEFISISIEPCTVHIKNILHNTITITDYNDYN
jgi:hypothetical protein